MILVAISFEIALLYSSDNRHSMMVQQFILSIPLQNVP